MKEIAFPVPAGVSNQGMNMRIPVCHSTEGLGYEDAAWEEHRPSRRRVNVNRTYV